MSGDYHIDDEIQDKQYDARLMRRLLEYLRPFKRPMALATFLLLAATALGTLVPYFNMIAIDRYIQNPARSELGRRVDAAPGAFASQLDTDAHRLTVLMGVMAGLIVLETLMRYAQMMFVTYVGQRTMQDMRLKIFAHLQDMSLRFLDRNPVGRLLTRVTGDVENIQQTIVAGLVQAIGEVVSIVFIFAMMLWLNWRLTLVALSVLPGIVVVSMVFRRYARASYLEIQRRIARLNAFTQENISGMRIVQAFGHEDRAFERYDRLNAEHRDEWVRQVAYFSYYFPAVDFLGALSIALVVLCGGRQILDGQLTAAGPASIGMLYAYMQWTERMFAPIRSLADKYNLLQAAMASSERIFKLLDTVPDIVNAPAPIECTKLRGEVELRGVSFAYEDERWVLKDVSLSIAPGERVAVVGHTGAGKTTLASLLSRFHDVQRGAVLIDGIDVREYEMTSLRTKIGVVLQDVYLFSGSVEFNIRMGDETMSDEHVRRCAEYVNAAGFIERLPGNYGYDVGERGCNLSSGQRQLLAFARTLAFDPQILVLDEATSSIDTETEALIQDATAKLMEGRTCIVIAHRLSTVQHADRIAVMHKGEIRETGTHQELLAQRGLYHTLYELQYRPQSPGAAALG